MSEQGYNGWANYETWCVSLWLGNEERSYSDTRQMAEDAHENLLSVHMFADSLREYVDALPEVERVLGVDQEASFVMDLLGASLNRVEWAEIAENLLSEFASG